MPSEPPAAPTSASPSDTALVERARRGDRRALAILYARHAPAVHARAAQAGLSPAAAARVLRDVFREASRSLGNPRASGDPGGWLRGLTMDRLAGARGPASRLHPATAAAVARSRPVRGPTVLSPAVRDAVWRELERDWHDDALPVWRRQPGALAATSLVGALLVAVALVGLQIREQIRPVTPVGATTLTAEPLEVPATEEEPPPPAPSVIVPPARTEEPFVPPEEPEDPTGTPVAPSPTPDPGPSETGTDGPDPDPTGTETEQPSDDPGSSPPLLPLPGGDDGSEDPSDPPSEDTGETDGGDAGGTAGGSREDAADTGADL